ncbi:response regulator transcription factor [Streptomyces uncialis]|uniref:response regulator transcription factor n=1 Tax=Streptomyces uncialis TaxID=1048205 RepID=UPI0037FF12D1
MERVLVVQEDRALADALLRELRRRGYAAVSVGTGAAALSSYRSADLVLLDLELSDIDGLEICRAVRDAGPTPVIAFTDRDTELDRVLALQAGADDCVIKSCGPRELIARIEAVLRRAYPGQTVAQTISLGPLHLDGRTRGVRLHDRTVEVTGKEFDLLFTLAASPTAAVSRKDLMSRVWGINWAQSSRTLDTHVSSLRGKLGAGGWIITVRGVGYRIGRG